MAGVAQIDTVVDRFRKAVGDLYGSRLERVVLFGSRARREAGPHSDYDIAVFLTEMPDRWVELNRLAELSSAFLDETGAVFDAKPYLAAALQERTPLMWEIRREGITL